MHSSVTPEAVPRWRPLAAWGAGLAVAAVPLFAAFETNVTDLVRDVGLLALVLALAGLAGAAFADRSERRFFVALTILAVAARVAMAAAAFAIESTEEDGGEDPYIMGNARSFDGKAWRWVEGGGGWWYEGEAVPGFLRFLVVTYKLFSPDAHRPFVPLFFVALVGGLLAPATAKAVGLLVSPRVGRVAGVVAAVLPEFVVHASVHIRDQFLALGYALGLYAAARLSRPRSALARRGDPGASWWRDDRARVRSEILRGTARAVLWATVGLGVFLFIKPSNAPLLALALLVLAVASRKMMRVGVAALPVLLVAVPTIAILDAASQDDLTHFGAYDTTDVLTLAAVTDKVVRGQEGESGSEAEAEASTARRIILALPSAIGIPLSAVWGAITPPLHLGAFWTVPSMRFTFFFRGVGWALAIPFLAYGAWWAVTSRRASPMSALLAGAAALAVAVAAVYTVADAWDGPRYRSEAAVFVSAAIAIGWHARSTSPIAWTRTRLLMIGVTTLHAALFAIGLLKLGFVRVPPLSLAPSAWLAFLLAPVSQDPMRTLQLATGVVLLLVYGLGVALLWPRRARSSRVAPTGEPRPAASAGGGGGAREATGGA